VAEALDHAHEHGVVHRDVKPANIMVLEDGRVKVMDFGVARLNTSNLTVVGTVVGSVRYMAPEQMLGQKVDGRADHFSLAALAYELLTGRAPYPGKTITEVVSRVVQGRHVPPGECDPRLPGALNAVFLRAFAVRPGDRPALAEDFAADLERAAAGALDLVVTYQAAEGEAESTVSAAATTAIPPAAAAPREGVLSVESRPPGAEVFVDGRPRGVTPVAEIELPFGRHELSLLMPGRDPVTLEVELKKDRPLRAIAVALPSERSGGETRRRFVEFGPGITPPRRIEGDLPDHPALALKEGLEGAPVLEVWIGETGEVIDLAVLESAGSRLDTALLEAVGRWRFSPAMRDGQPVPVRITVQHVFRV
jgi:TonB family protein